MAKRTIETLNDQERRIFDALPHSLQATYLDLLPEAKGDPRKAAAIEQHADFLAQVGTQIQVEVRRLRELAREVRTAGGSVDLRKVLGPPSIEGLRIAFTRSRPSTAPRRDELGHAGGDGTRGGSPAAEAGAPYGRDRVGEVFAPWGYKQNGTPARPKGPKAKQLIDDFIARRTENPGLTAAEVNETAPGNERRDG